MIFLVYTPCHPAFPSYSLPSLSVLEITSLLFVRSFVRSLIPEKPEIARKFNLAVILQPLNILKLSQTAKRNVIT
ncbi:hypothetical protein B0H16DRAFT_1750286 [Mycena metata]|uniref:Uncharacterized protein n=1 Tax=Mycena metata TaxID=1033252 RepID=A0AAD7GNX3_9AGAR|nr:hypothetical protein B0H16DRAFT_1750286 [Mycena metata]